MKLALGLLLACGIFNACGVNELAENTVEIVYEDSMFTVIDAEGVHQVQNCFVDKELRNRTEEEILRYANHDNYFLVSRMSDGEYAVHGRGRLLGGGPGGAYAGCVAGHLVGNAIVFTGVGVASAGVGLVATAVGGPAAGATATAVAFKSISATAVPFSQPFVHAMAIGGGIAGGIATGPTP